MSHCREPWRSVKNTLLGSVNQKAIGRPRYAESPLSGHIKPSVGFVNHDTATCSLNSATACVNSMTMAIYATTTLLRDMSIVASTPGSIIFYVA